RSRQKARTMDSAKGPKAKCGAEPSRRADSAPLELETVRRRLQEKRGPEYWRSLDELAGTPEFQELLHREFPRQASEWVDGADSGLVRTGSREPVGNGPSVSPRASLRRPSPSLPLPGLTGCPRQPLEKIVPYVEQP